MEDPTQQDFTEVLDDGVENLEEVDQPKEGPEPAESSKAKNQAWIIAGVSLLGALVVVAIVIQRGQPVATQQTTQTQTNPETTQQIKDLEAENADLRSRSAVGVQAVEMREQNKGGETADSDTAKGKDEENDQRDRQRSISAQQAQRRAFRSAPQRSFQATRRPSPRRTSRRLPTIIPPSESPATALKQTKIAATEPTTAKPSPAPTAVTLPTTPAPVTVDPEERYQRLLGYSQFSNADEYQPPATGAPTIDSSPLIPVAETTELEPIIELETLTALEPIAGTTTTNDNAQDIHAGSIFKAELLSSAAWAQDVPLTDGVVLARLKETMGSLVKGTVLTLKVTQASESGFLALQPQAAAIDGQTIDLPEGLIAQGRNGKPLRGKRKGNGGGLKLTDVTGVLFGAARGAATFANRTRTSSIISTNGISSATTNNDQGSILAAIGGGLADQVLARAQDQTNRIQRVRQPYWLMPTGSNLEIMVTKNVQI